VGADLIADLAATSSELERLISVVRPEQWGAPTPCSEWSVRNLVNHLVGSTLLFADALRGQPVPPPDELRQRSQQDRLRADATGAYHRAVDALLTLFRQPGALDRQVEVPVGTVSGVVALHLRLVETLVHGWDLARSTGQPVSFDQRVAEQELEFTRFQLRHVPPERSPFAASQPVSQDAPPLDRLVALLGRSSAWHR
jgi:uncharacterized protein (TIGR03086 family)